MNHVLGILLIIAALGYQVFKSSTRWLRKIGSHFRELFNLETITMRKYMHAVKKLSLIILMWMPALLFSQQVADTTYRPPIPDPAYSPGDGPVVFVDEGHHNFHTKSGRYRAFSDLLERDGYVVRSYAGEFEKSGLKEGKILVISNALHPFNDTNWYKPVLSAFSPKEIKTVKKWVKQGGNLFLIADHMPMGGAAADLAAGFGFEFTNGFAMDTASRGPAFFNREDGSLNDCILTNGRNESERVDRIASFTGQAFTIPWEATPVLVFQSNYVNLETDTAWVFDERTSIYNVDGWAQGAFRTYGKGKVVAFGEAAMFTAQLAGPNQIRMGMNNDAAPENYQLLMNIVHWLDGKLE
jgi:hypothetical protein